MNNPLPRGNGFFAQLQAAKNQRLQIEEAAKDLDATPEEMAKANALVAQILEKGEAIIEAYDEDELVPAYDPFDKPAPIQRYVPTRGTHFELPSLENCGLVNPNIQLDESQLAAVEAMKNKQYACLIGAAGTGKTTVQKYLIREIIYGENSTFQVRGIQNSSRCNIGFVAFTGMAVQVMKSNLPEWLHACCHTIHGILEFKPESDGESRMFVPTRHNLNKLNEDLLIIDEASMVGMELWIQLIRACKRGTRIIMTGDLNQLPPIIGQPIFAYALSNWHVSELTTVHRQKGVGANRIIDIAHEVLSGQKPIFDSSKENPNWRVLWGDLDKNPEVASKQILQTLMALRKKVMPDEHGNMIPVYNPHKDRVMTAGNGYDMNKTSDLVQQAPLNEHLAVLVDPPNDEHPRIIIDAGRSWKKFAVHNRVMATKNEPPDRENRVTNGQAGVIVSIEPNHRYKGNRGKVGTEAEVAAYRKKLLSESHNDFTLNGVSNLELDEDDLAAYGEENEQEAAEGGAASHIVKIDFDNGATREYNTKAAVDGIQLAYCSTVAKCQGSQFDTAIIICHPAQKSQLSREWLYTAITRAAKRVIILGTDYGIRYAISRQKISGKTIADKVERYRALMNEGIENYVGVRNRVNVPITVEDYFDNHHLYEDA